MFSGIIEEMGVLTAKSSHLGGIRLGVMAKRVLANLEIGESLAVNGVCLTVVDCQSEVVSADISTETAQRTTLGQLQIGDAVNLERALRYHGRVGGHLVTGHVDGIGRIHDRRQEDNTWYVRIDLSKELLRYCVSKGSIAIDGISLTINEVGEQEIGVAIIPHTANVTTLGLNEVGTLVNVETDIIGKYVERLLARDREGQNPRIDLGYLKREGLL